MPEPRSTTDEIRRRLEEIEQFKASREERWHAARVVLRESLPNFIGTVLGGGVIALFGVAFGLLDSLSTSDVVLLAVTVVSLLGVVVAFAARPVVDPEEEELLRVRLELHELQDQIHEELRLTKAAAGMDFSTTKEAAEKANPDA